MTDKELIKKYPFLAIRNMDDKVIKDAGTYLDDVPAGWRDLFMETCGAVMCRLKKTGMVKKYRLSQVKEKFGSLRVYDNIVDNTPEKDGVSNLWLNAEVVSCRMCIMCGKPAKWMSVGYIAPYCTECRQAAEEDTDIDLKFNEIR